MALQLSRIILIGLVCVLIFNADSTTSAATRDRSFYYGTWIDSALYNEMIRTKSPYASRDYCLNQAVLHSRPEGTRYFGWSDGSDYVDSAFTDSVIILKKPGDERHSLELKIVDDSTLVCDHFFGDTTIIFRRMAPTPPQDNRPFEWFFEQKYFKGMKKILTVATNSTATVTFADSGKIISSPDLKGYGTIIGGLEGLPLFDILWLTTRDDSLLCLSYELAGDTILVYELLWKDESGKIHESTGDWHEEGVYRGPLKYKLTAAGKSHGH